MRLRSLRLYADTIRHLKAQQILGRLWHRLYRPAPDLRLAPALRMQAGEWLETPRGSSSLVGPDRIVLLNHAADISDGGIWEDATQSKLWLYNLHYFDDLTAQDAGDRADWHDALIERWIGENPPARGTGWEPYPSSLRVVNWIKRHLTHKKLNDPALQSLAVQVRHLRRRLEYHILGNHLLANAKALIFAGALFDGAEGEAWLIRGRQLLDREIGEQILEDGGHFERSPMYHLIVLEDLLDCVNICRTYQLALPRGIEAAIQRMLVWSRHMRHPDGGIPFFNDAALNIAQQPEKLDEYARGLGFRITPTQPAAVTHLAASGYARLQVGEAVLFADMATVGPDFLPGHAHADSLSFELSVGGQRVVVNGGTSEYGVGRERQRQRGTAAHSTLVIDEHNSSEVWGGFRVARRARILESSVVKNGAAEAIAAHDGYRYLPGRPVHKRTWRLLPDGLEVEDIVQGSGRHTLEQMFHLHPDMIAEEIGGRFRLHGPGGVEITVCPPPKAKTRLQTGTWHPEFGLTNASQSLCFSVSANLPVTLTTHFEWQRA